MERELVAVLFELAVAVMAALGIGLVVRRPAEPKKQPQIFS
ncbi:MAG TPA: hypothetical protein VGL09_22285 [Methylomirabilota bacterium]